MEEQEAPWSVEVPKSQVNRLLGPNGSTLKRLSAACGCEIEVSRQRGQKKGVKSVSYGGQTQYYEDGDGDAEAPVKVFIRGGARKRLVAAEVLRAVAAGDDPEDHAARAEGAIVFEHSLQHPDKEAWARWRLLAVAHAHGASAHVGRKTARLVRKGGAGAFSEEAAESALEAAEEAMAEAGELTEVKVEALDELEPEEAPSDKAVTPLVDQYGVMVRVCDQDDNAVSEFITLRLFGPPEATKDAADMLTARFVGGKATASILQTPGEVQGLTGDHASDFAGDLQALEAECQVTVHKGRTALWISGDDADKVADARKTLQDMLQFYLPSSFLLVEGLQPSAIEHLLADEDLGVLMARDDCAVMIDEEHRSAWICGKQRAAVQRRIDEASRAPPRAAAAAAAATAAGEEAAPPPAKRRRRTDALSFASEAVA